MSDDLTDLRARIKAIHKQDTFLDVPCCSTCRDPDWPAERPAMWPCPTIRAVLAGPADTDGGDGLRERIEALCADDRTHYYFVEVSSLRAALWKGPPDDRR